MRRFLLILLIIAPFSAHATPPEAAPARVVSLKPSITDVVVALGARDKLVGVTRYCSGAKGVAIAGDYTQPYIERIVALDPDMVLGSEENSSRRSVEQLKRMGIRVKLFPFTTIGETLSSIRLIGEAIGKGAEGDELSRKTARAFEELKKKWKGADPVSTVVVWGTRPLVVAGPGTYMDELLRLIGARNPIKGTSIKYPHVGLEELIAMDPDAIVDLSMGSEASTDDAAVPGSAGEKPGRRPWDGVSSIRAVREGRVISLDASLFRAGPNLPEGLAKLGEMLHR